MIVGYLPLMRSTEEVDMTARQGLRWDKALSMWILRSDGLGGTAAEKRSLERL